MSSSCPRTLVAELCFPTSGSFSLDCGEGEREREGVNAQKYTWHHITKLYWVFLYCHTFHIELAKSYNKQAGLTIWPIKLQHRGQRPEDYRCFQPSSDHPLHTASNRFLLVNSWRSETHPFMSVPISGNMQAKRQDNAWYSHHMPPPRARVNRTISNTYGNKHHWAIPEFPAYKRSASTIFTHTYIYTYIHVYIDINVHIIDSNGQQWCEN